jgi:hypothetical protein
MKYSIFQVGQFPGRLEFIGWIIIYRDTMFGLTQGITIEPFVIILILSQLLQLSQVFVNGFGLDYDHLSHFMDNGTVNSGLVVIKLKDSTSISGNAYNSECHTFTYTWQI